MTFRKCDVLNIPVKRKYEQIEMLPEVWKKCYDDVSYTMLYLIPSYTILYHVEAYDTDWRWIVFSFYLL